MAIANVAQAQGRTLGNVASLTFPMSVPAGNDRLLMLAVQWNPGSGDTINISSITYGSQSMTQVTSGLATNSERCRSALYYLVAPNVGTNSIVITLSATSAGLIAEASAWTGVAQSSTFDTAVTATGTNNTPTVNETSSASGDMIIDSVAQNPDNSVEGLGLTVGAGQAELWAWDGLSSPTAPGFWGGSSYESSVGQPTTMSWSSTSTATNHEWAIVTVPINPSATVSDPVSANTDIAEVALVPWRAAPALAPTTTGLTATEQIRINQQAQWELAGQYPRVVRVTIQPDNTLLWDDVYTINSVMEAGQIIVSELPTPQSPKASLVVVTQDTLAQYPLPQAPDEALGQYPNNAAALSGGTDLMPLRYPSVFDFGELTHLVGMEVMGQHFTRETDGMAVAWRWDDMGDWKEEAYVFEPFASWGPFDANHGRFLQLAITIYDGAATEPIGPQVVEWKLYTESWEGDDSRPARSDPEVS